MPGVFPTWCTRPKLFWFTVQFVLIYGILIAPWPGFGRAYGAYFRFVHRHIFSEESGHRLVRFEPEPLDHGPLDTRIAIVNLQRLDGEGRAQGKALALDSRSVGWIPTSIVLALVWATPLARHRRISASLAGLLMVHLFIVFSVGCYIWNQSAELGILKISPMAKVVLSGLEQTFIVQLGASFIVPVVIWVLVSFRAGIFSGQNQGDGAARRS
jgi:hypothetical protein